MGVAPAVAATRTVAVVLHETELGGASRSVLRAVPLLEEMGWAFAFWAPSPSPLVEELLERGLHVEGANRTISFSGRVLLSPPGPWRRIAALAPYLRAFGAFLRRLEPALVHANSDSAVVEATVARRAGVPAFLHVHEVVPAGVRGWLIRHAARRLEAVAAVSRASAASMRAGSCEPRVIYEAAPVPAAGLELRPEPVPFRIGTVGAVSKRKGTDIFVDAAALAQSRDSRLKFEIVGGLADGVDLQWARSQIQRARAAGIEHVENADVPVRLASWDAFALPSRIDPCPIALLEAMAHGLPVIGSRAGGIPEEIGQGCGLLVDAERPDQLAAAMVKVASMDLAGRVAMGESARRRVAEHFSLERQALGLDAAYRAALERRAGHGGATLRR